MKPRKTAFLPALLLSLLSVGLFVQAQSKPNVSGTWKMNAAKSKFEGDGPSAITIKFDDQGSSLRESFTITNGQGERTMSFSYTLDGKESLQELEGQQIKATAKREGESLSIELKADNGFNFLRKITVSSDGKTMTMDVKKSASGYAASDLVVLEKQ